MTRRRFMLLAGATAIAWHPAAAEIKVPRIGFIQPGSRQENQSLLDAFRGNLAALGWTDASNIDVLDRWAEERTERLPAIVKELIGSGASVLVTGGTLATLAAKHASATIPIILVGVDDPVSLGVVDSLGRPGGNATGLSLTSSEVIGERLDLLRELVPGLHRLAVIVRDDPGIEQKLQDIRSEAQRKGIEALMLETTTGKALDLAFARLRADRCEAIYVASGPFGPAKRTRLIAPRRGISTACDLLLPHLSPRRGIDVVWRRLWRPVPPSRGLRRQDPQGSQARRHAGRTAPQVRFDSEPQDREGARPDDSTRDARRRRQGHRIRSRLSSRSASFIAKIATILKLPNSHGKLAVDGVPGAEPWPENENNLKVRFRCRFAADAALVNN